MEPGRHPSGLRPVARAKRRNRGGEQLASVGSPPRRRREGGDVNRLEPGRVARRLGGAGRGDDLGRRHGDGSLHAPRATTREHSFGVLPGVRTASDWPLGVTARMSTSGTRPPAGSCSTWSDIPAALCRSVGRRWQAPCLRCYGRPDQDLDPTTGQDLMSLPGNGAAWSRDGQRLATVGDPGGTIRVYDASTGYARANTPELLADAHEASAARDSMSGDLERSPWRIRLGDQCSRGLHSL